jgi:hypothetical protein
VAYGARRSADVEPLSRRVAALRPTARALGAFAMCFAVGALLSVLFGVASKTWVPAGLVVSTVVAMSVRGK